jgi:hypothetical protein
MTLIRRLATLLALAFGAAAPTFAEDVVAPPVPPAAQAPAAPNADAPSASQSAANAPAAKDGGAAAEAAPTPPSWSQQDNVVEAAKHIAVIQRKQGAQKAVDFIDACYRTHSLASAYTRAFEACIARDYILSQALAGLYAQIPPEELARRKMPSPASLTRAMGQRVAAAFKQYEISPSAAESFRVLVEKQGFPVFMAIAFPPVKEGDGDKAGKGRTEGGKPGKGDGSAPPAKTKGNDKS